MVVNRIGINLYTFQGLKASENIQRAVSCMFNYEHPIVCSYITRVKQILCFTYTSG